METGRSVLLVEMVVAKAMVEPVGLVRLVRRV